MPMWHAFFGESCAVSRPLADSFLGMASTRHHPQRQCRLLLLLLQSLAHARAGIKQLMTLVQTDSMPVDQFCLEKSLDLQMSAKPSRVTGLPVSKTDGSFFELLDI